MRAKIEKEEKEKLEKENDEKKLQAREKQQEWLNTKITKVSYYRTIKRCITKLLLFSCNNMH